MDNENGEEETYNFGICAGGVPPPVGECSPELEAMDAQSACKAVEQKKKGFFDAISDIASTVGSVYETALGIFGSNAEVAQETLSTLGIDIETDTIIDQMATCDGIVSQFQTNEIVGPSRECVEAWGNLGVSTSDIKKAGTINGADQRNFATAVTDCRANMAIEALSQMDASIDSIALQEALAEAKGLFSGSKVEQKTCNDVSVNQSACKYIRQNQCCTNTVAQRQNNLISTGCALGPWGDLTQENNASAEASCSMAADSSVSDVTTSAIVNRTSQGAEAKSVGLDLWGGLIILVIVVVVGGIIAKMFLKKPKIAPFSMGGKAGAMSKTSKVFLVLGIVEIIVGVACVVLYFATRTKEVEVVDEPFILCDNTVPFKLDGNDSSSNRRGTFKQMKDIAEGESRIVGFDFIPDDQGLDPNQLPDDTLGMGVFLAQVDRDDSPNNKCQRAGEVFWGDEFQRERSVSILKAQGNINFLIGSPLILLGIIQIVVALL